MGETVNISSVFEEKKKKRKKKIFVAVLAISIIVVSVLFPTFVLPRLVGGRGKTVGGYEVFDMLVVSELETMRERKIICGSIRIASNSSLNVIESEIKADLIEIEKGGVLLLEKSSLEFLEIRGDGRVIAVESELAGRSIEVAKFDGTASVINCTVEAVEVKIKGCDASKISVCGGNVSIVRSPVDELVAENSSVEVRDSKLNVTVECSNLTASDSVIARIELCACNATMFGCEIDHLVVRASNVSGVVPPKSLSFDNVSVIEFNSTFAIEFYDAGGEAVVGSVDISTKILDEMLYVAGHEETVSVPTVRIAGGHKTISNVTVMPRGFVVAAEGAPFSGGIIRVPPDFSGTLKIYIGESELMFAESSAVLENIEFEANVISFEVYSDGPAAVRIVLPWEPRTVTYEGAKLIKGGDPGWDYVNGTLVIRLPPSGGETVVISRTAAGSTVIKKDNASEVFKWIAVVGTVIGVIAILLVLRFLVCLPAQYMILITVFGVVCVAVALLGGWQYAMATGLIGIPIMLLVSWLLLRRTCPVG